MSIELDPHFIQTVTHVLIAIAVAAGMFLLVRFAVQHQQVRRVVVRVERRQNQFRRMDSDPDPRYTGIGPANLDRGPPDYNDFTRPDQHRPLR